jgi:hypothetical protein
MSLTTKDILRSFSGHESLFQNFYNRQTAYCIFALEQSVIVTLLNSILKTLNFFQRCRIEIPPQPSMSATIGMKFTVNNNQ